MLFRSFRLEPISAPLSDLNTADHAAFHSGDPPEVMIGNRKVNLDVNFPWMPPGIVIDWYSLPTEEDREWTFAVIVAEWSKVVLKPTKTVIRRYERYLSDLKKHNYMQLSSRKFIFHTTSKQKTAAHKKEISKKASPDFLAQASSVFRGDGNMALKTGELSEIKYDESLVHEVNQEIKTMAQAVESKVPALPTGWIILSDSGPTFFIKHGSRNQTFNYNPLLRVGTFMFKHQYAKHKGKLVDKNFTLAQAGVETDDTIEIFDKMNGGGKTKKPKETVPAPDAGKNPKKDKPKPGPPTKRQCRGCGKLHKPDKEGKMCNIPPQKKGICIVCTKHVADFEAHPDGKYCQKKDKPKVDVNKINKQPAAEAILELSDETKPVMSATNSDSSSSSSSDSSDEETNPPAASPPVDQPKQPDVFPKDKNIRNSMESFQNFTLKTENEIYVASNDDWLLQLKDHLIDVWFDNKYFKIIHFVSQIISTYMSYRVFKAIYAKILQKYAEQIIELIDKIPKQGYMLFLWNYIKLFLKYSSYMQFASLFQCPSQSISSIFMSMMMVIFCKPVRRMLYFWELRNHAVFSNKALPHDFWVDPYKSPLILLPDGDVIKTNTSGLKLSPWPLTEELSDKQMYNKQAHEILNDPRVSKHFAANEAARPLLISLYFMQFVDYQIFCPFKKKREYVSWTLFDPADDDHIALTFRDKHRSSLLEDVRPESTAMGKIKRNDPTYITVVHTVGRNNTVIAQAKTISMALVEEAISTPSLNSAALDLKQIESAVELMVKCCHTINMDPTLNFSQNVLANTQQYIKHYLFYKRQQLSIMERPFQGPPIVH